MIMGDPRSNEIGMIGQRSGEQWSNWSFDDGAGVSMPLDDNEQDTSLVGMALDCSSVDQLPGANVDDPSSPPVPILLLLLNTGALLAFHCIDTDTIRDGDACPMMTQASEIPKPADGTSSAQFAQKAIPVPNVTKAAPTPSAFGGTVKSNASLFGTPGATTGSAFGGTVKSSPSPFGTLGTSTGSAFGFNATSSSSLSAGAALPQTSTTQPIPKVQGFAASQNASVKTASPFSVTSAPSGVTAGPSTPASAQIPAHAQASGGQASGGTKPPVGEPQVNSRF